jgi:hypothetical protein
LFYKKQKNLIELYPKKKIKRSIGSFHPKIMLIKFEEHLRVVIGSGNLSSGDWILWINSFITIDFKKKIVEPKKYSLRRSIKKLKSRNESKKSIPMNSKSIDRELETDIDENFNMKVYEYSNTLKNIGYNFKDYLRNYMSVILGNKFGYLEKFLKIDFDKYNLTQNEVYLVGSLPGAYKNHCNYSYPTLMKAGMLSLDFKSFVNTLD